MTQESEIAGHWNYSQGILEAGGIDELAVRVGEYFYKQAWVHGRKHLIQDLVAEGILTEDYRDDT